MNEKLEDKLDTYLDMLADGEHIILDVDHYLSMLKFIEESPESPETKAFWSSHHKIAHNHAEQFIETERSIDAVVKRLETCNFFRIVKESPNRYTLLLGSDIPKKFMKVFLMEVLNGMGFKAQITESFAKLSIYLDNLSY
ncbi:MAG: CopG-like domain-containing protein DNA-binding protein [Promethearchaeota archaeon]|nr:MAG: CopG-like domain-containing protein DNA-binding protein [Candidatus Lokiarchaeota archaeon]